MEPKMMENGRSALITYGKNQTTTRPDIVL